MYRTWAWIKPGTWTEVKRAIVLSFTEQNCLDNPEKLLLNTVIAMFPKHFQCTNLLNPILELLYILEVGLTLCFQLDH